MARPRAYTVGAGRPVPGQYTAVGGRGFGFLQHPLTYLEGPPSRVYVCFPRGGVVVSASRPLFRPASHLLFFLSWSNTRSTSRVLAPAILIIHSLQQWTIALIQRLQTRRLGIKSPDALTTAPDLRQTICSPVRDDSASGLHASRNRNSGKGRQPQSTIQQLRDSLWARRWRDGASHRVCCHHR